MIIIAEKDIFERRKEQKVFEKETKKEKEYEYESFDSILQAEIEKLRGKS